MNLTKTSLPGVVTLTPQRHADARGHFSETFVADWFRQNVADTDFVQDNESLSVETGTMRGMHFQTSPFAQGKLLRVITGAIADFVVDVRHGSASFGKWIGVEISAEAGNQIWIPPGFAHGFCTLGPNTIVNYKVTAPYSRDHDKGVAWNDPDIGIIWPAIADAETLSEKDRGLPRLAELPRYFEFDAAKDI